MIPFDGGIIALYFCMEKSWETHTGTMTIKHIRIHDFHGEVFFQPIQILTKVLQTILDEHITSHHMQN